MSASCAYLARVVMDGLSTLKDHTDDTLKQSAELCPNCENEKVAEFLRGKVEGLEIAIRMMRIQMDAHEEGSE